MYVIYNSYEKKKHTIVIVEKLYNQWKIVTGGRRESPDGHYVHASSNKEIGFVWFYF